VGITPFGGLAFIPLLDEKISINIDVESKEILIDSETFGPLFGTPGDGGITAELGNIAIIYPILGIDGELNDTGLIVGKDSTKIVDANLDIDGILSLVIVAAPGIPVPAFSGINIDVKDFLDVSFDFIDIEAGPTINLIQDYKIDAGLGVTLAFDTPVDIEGGWHGSHHLDRALGRSPAHCR
jgi:hypothetical protein